MTIGRIVDVLGILVFTTEIALLVLKRAHSDKDVVTDNKSLRLIWRTIGVGIGLTFLSKTLLPHPLFARSLFEYGASILLIGGMALRWFSILCLGREFTVNVAIIEGHRLVTTGPYKFIRHPSYTGLILIFLGLGIHSNHLVGLLALSLPVLWAVRNRINIEEQAMEAFFGVEYTEYQRKTKKLIPYIY